MNVGTHTTPSYLSSPALTMCMFLPENLSTQHPNSIYFSVCIFLKHFDSLICCRSDMLQRCIVIVLRHLVKDGRMVHFLFALIAPVFPLAVILCCLLLEFVKPGFGIMAGLQAHYAKKFGISGNQVNAKPPELIIANDKNHRFPEGNRLWKYFDPIPTD